MPLIKTKLLLVIKLLVFVLLFAWYGVFWAHKIDLTTADLGRHIQNGNIIVNGSWPKKQAVLNTNYYSYTLPESSFVNHHWLSGVVFYGIHQVFGFKGLSVFYVLLGFATLLLFWDVAKKASNFWIASFVAVILIPLISSRAEVRPEVFTYFFTGVFFWILWNRRQGLISARWLWILPCFMLIWVNLHIGFVFGFLVLGAFGIEQLIRALGGKDNNFKPLLILGLLSVLAGLINPFGYKLFLYPLNIFKNYGYLIVENQSIKFLENLNFIQNMHFLLYKIVVGLLALSFAAVLIKNWRKMDLVSLILVFVTGVMAYLGIRHFPSFGFFVLPVLAGNLYLLKPVNFHPAYKYTAWLLAFVAVFVSLFQQYQNFALIRPVLGLGLLPQAEASADFILNNKLQGPIFNDYDIGGYLIYKLYPKKVFVDNRPEAYTVDFFENIYKAAQTNPDKWKELDKQYKFNLIIFSYRDYTPWAQQFLINKVADPDWAPVFVDQYNIIFLKRNQENAGLIKKFELPKEMFGISSM